MQPKTKVRGYGDQNAVAQWKDLTIIHYTRISSTTALSTQHTCQGSSRDITPYWGPPSQLQLIGRANLKRAAGMKGSCRSHGTESVLLCDRTSTGVMLSILGGSMMTMMIIFMATGESRIGIMDYKVVSKSCFRLEINKKKNNHVLQDTITNH